jgi:hypothetical protein
VPVTAIILDLFVLSGFVWVKLNSDPYVIAVAVFVMILIACGEHLYLGSEARKRIMHREHNH